jgi:hypothetical protein
MIAALQGATEAQTDNSLPILSERPPVQIVSHRIGTDYYPMLDRKSPVANAESSDFPRTDIERMQRRSRRGEETRTQGKLRSRVVIVDDAQWIRVTVKNTAGRAVKTIEWDFAFPRYEQGQLVLRYDVSTDIEIKPGGKKTLKQQLPPGAKACQIVDVSADQNPSGNSHTLEAVCGPGFHDPSQLKLKQETVSIRRIHYADGTVWQRNQP